VRPNISIKLSGPRLRTVKRATAFAPDDKTLAYGCGDGSVGLLDVETGACHRLASHTSNTILTAVKVVQFSSSGRFLASASFTNIVKLWDLKKGNKYYSLTGFHDSSVTDLAFSPNEQYLASAGSRDEKLALWNVAQSTLHANLSGHTSTISSVEFLDDGMTLISACYDDTVRL
jgi:WD40 repeat protein